jgi:Prokaryotic phospholipase A2
MAMKKCLMVCTLTMVVAFSTPAQVYAQLECLPTDRVDCSADWLKVVPPVAAYSEIFANACLIHDYCYRFGAATYGYSRSTCDKKFHSDMRDICGDVTVWDVISLGTIMEACYAAAGAFYTAVRTLGEGAFMSKANGKVCHYEVVFPSEQGPHVPLSTLLPKYWVLFF